MPREKHPRAVAMGVALRRWCRENNYTLSQIRDLLEAPQELWSGVLAGNRFVEARYPDFYARLYRLTGLAEFDPTDLPDRADGKPRRWSFENLISWWKNQYPDEYFTPRVQNLTANSCGGREAGYIAQLLSGHEDDTLVTAHSTLVEVLHGDLESREEFCINNQLLMQQMRQVLDVLTQPETNREGVIKLMEVTHD